MPTVWLIRHGESTSNANLRTVHPTLSALTPLGERQAVALVQAFTTKPDLVVVSSYLRARQTAVPTITHFSPISVAEWPVHEFTYLAPQRYAGTTGEERAPFARDYWLRNDPFYKDEGEGESFAELLERVWRLVARLKQQEAPFVALFSHGLFLRALFWAVLTNTTEATPNTMQRYGYFLQGVWLPNAAISRANFTLEQISFSGFDTNHLQNM